MIGPSGQAFAALGGQAFPVILEFLGLWEETDYEWLLLDEEEVAENDERSDPVPEGKESTEIEDES